MGHRQHALGSRAVLGLEPGVLRAIAEALSISDASLRVDVTGDGLVARRGADQLLKIDRGMLEVGPILCDLWELDDAEDLPSWFAAAVHPSCALIAVPRLVLPGEETPSLESIPIGTVAPVGQPCIFIVRTDLEQVWQAPAGAPRCSLEDLPEAMATGSPSAWSVDSRRPLTQFRSGGGASVVALAGPTSGALVLQGFVDLPNVGVRAGRDLGVISPEGSRVDAAGVSSLVHLAKLDDQKALRLSGNTLSGPAGVRWYLASP